MSKPRHKRWPVLVVGTGGFFLALQLAEWVLLATGVETLHSGYLLGIATSGLFLGTLLYGSVWLVRSRIPAMRYRRIGLWCLGGAALSFVLITVITTSVNRAGRLFVLATIRWSGSLGGAIGLGIGIMHAQVIEQRRTAERLAARQEMLERERDRLDEFAGIISHDLRNPLNVAASRLELARSDCESDHHDEIEAALDRMEVIIEDTLALARHGQRVGETESVDLETIAQRSWQVISQTGATLEVESSCQVQADPTRIKHVFENLYRNSVEHAEGEVTLRVGALPDTAGFYVADDGPGIPPADRDSVFDRGHTTAEGGTGLGLTIVHSIARAHGWSVNVTDSESGGARFEFTEVGRR